MRNISYSIAAFACVCLLTRQLSGLHLHVDPVGNDAGMHGTHVHDTDPDDHDHSADIDVSLLEQLSSSWSKLIPLLIICFIVLAAVAWTQIRLRSPPVQSGNVRYRVRLRPLLRAPPFSL